MVAVAPSPHSSSKFLTPSFYTSTNFLAPSFFERFPELLRSLTILLKHPPSTTLQASSFFEYFPQNSSLKPLRRSSLFLTTRHILSTHDALGRRVLRCALTHAPSHSLHFLTPCACCSITTRHILSTHDALGRRVLRFVATQTWTSPRTAFSSAPARTHPCIDCPLVLCVGGTSPLAC